jgi:LysM repeat protein
MEPRLEKINWLKKIKTLTHALILSGALNIGFFSALCVIAFKNVQKKPVKTPQALEYTKAPLFVSSDSMELLSQYFDFPYERLIQELKDTHLVEDGYAKRDYALACLVSYHYFDLSKALSGMQLETRTLEFVHQEGGERAKIEVFPGFLDMHFEAIVHFAKLEKWPFTPQGLHVHVKSAKEKGKIPFSLQEAFYLTPQFQWIWRSLSSWKPTISSEALLKMLAEVDWDIVEKFYGQLMEKKQFSEENCRQFLLSLIDGKSKEAAAFAIEMDREFILNKLDDQSILFLLEVLSKQQTKPELVARHLLISVRSDAVRVAAGKKLYELASEKVPVPYDHAAALVKFLPNFFDKSQFAIQPKAASQPVAPLKIQKKRHTVVKGDTLWKIATSYKVSIKDLSKINHLQQNAVIKPGMILEIP